MFALPAHRAFKYISAYRKARWIFVRPVVASSDLPQARCPGCGCGPPGARKIGVAALENDWEATLRLRAWNKANRMAFLFLLVFVSPSGWLAA